MNSPVVQIMIRNGPESLTKAWKGARILHGGGRRMAPWSHPFITSYHKDESFIMNEI